MRTYLLPPKSSVNPYKRWPHTADEKWETVYRGGGGGAVTEISLRGYYTGRYWRSCLVSSGSVGTAALSGSVCMYTVVRVGAASVMDVGVSGTEGGALETANTWLGRTGGRARSLNRPSPPQADHGGRSDSPGHRESADQQPLVRWVPIIQKTDKHKLRHQADFSSSWDVRAYKHMNYRKVSTSCLRAL